jgi:hypothetical protein
LTFDFFVLFFWWDWGLNSEFHACKAGTLIASAKAPVHFAVVILEIESPHELFAQYGLKLPFPSRPHLSI